MGAGHGKASEELVTRIGNAKAALETGQITLGEAQRILGEIGGDIEKTLSGDALKDARGRLRQLHAQIDELEELEEIAAEEAAERRRTEDAMAQRAKGRRTSDLVAIYSQEYGSGAVAKLLTAGKSNGGYRNPREGLDLRPIAADVHVRACAGGGFSSATSISNGLVNRIREQSSVVVRYAYEAGYPVEHDEVKKAMGVLAREVAFTLDSDSGGREETKENMARGMGYNMDTRVPGLDPALLKGGFSNDPATILRSHREAVVALQFRIDKSSGPEREKLVQERKRIETEIRELEARGVT